MPTHCRTDSLDFGSVEGRSIVAAFDGGEITSDGGALLLARTNGAIRLIDRVAAAFTDRRNPDLIEHEVVTMAGQRIIGEALGYPDLNDHDRLRHDPLLASIIGKLEARDKRCAPLAYVLICALRRIALAGTKLARATCATIRLCLLKIGAHITVSVRRVKVALATGCPWRELFETAHARLSAAAR